MSKRKVKISTNVDPEKRKAVKKAVKKIKKITYPVESASQEYANNIIEGIRDQKITDIETIEVTLIALQDLIEMAHNEGQKYVCKTGLGIPFKKGVYFV